MCSAIRTEAATFAAMIAPDAPRPLHASPAILLIAVVAGLVLLYAGRSVMAPLAFALFVLAVVWPLREALRDRLGKTVAVLGTALLTAAIVLGFFVAGAVALSRIAAWFVGHLSEVESAVTSAGATLDAAGVPLADLSADPFDPDLVLGPAREVASLITDIGGFLVIAFVFLVLGLIELDRILSRLGEVRFGADSPPIAAITARIARKFRLHLKIYALISVADGVLCYVFFRMIGLEEALAWAVLTGILNFIPFIGPLIIAVLLVPFSAAQFGSLGMVVLAVGGTTAINFTLGSYVQPLVAGNAVSMSAMLVLFSVSFWAIIWGIPGAFLGIPLTIVVLAACAATPRLAWISHVLSGEEPPPVPAIDASRPAG